jgi:hypothetical protein
MSHNRSLLILSTAALTVVPFTTPTAMACPFARGCDHRPLGGR